MGPPAKGKRYASFKIELLGHADVNMIINEKPSYKGRSLPLYGEKDRERHRQRETDRETD